MLKELRVEIHEGLNLIESWNSVNNFICFGSKSEFQSNDPYIQEMIVLCIHLLQNSMILTNTIMIDKVIEENNLLELLTAEDKSSLNPLSTGIHNPYGTYNLSLNKPSFLEVA
jgi:TnpA family transposase